MKTELCIVVNVLTSLAMHCARPSSNSDTSTDEWTYDKLVKKSDVIVICEFISFEAWPDENGAIELENSIFRDSKSVSVITTRFQVHSTLRGSTDNEIGVVHFRWNQEVINSGKIAFVQFESSLTLRDRFELKTNEVIAVDSTKDEMIVPEYLLFLRLREDGLFEPTSGQLHPAKSFRLLNN